MKEEEGAYAKTPIQRFLIQTLVIDVPRLRGPQMHSVPFSYYLNSIQFVKKDLVEKIIFLIRKKKKRKRRTRIFYQYILKRVAQTGIENFYSARSGTEGFEPPNTGTKTRCLTTWRRPISISIWY